MAILIFPSDMHEVDIRIFVCKYLGVGWMEAGDRMLRNLECDNWYIKL